MTAPKASAIIPLLMVTNMERSLAFYTEGFGFTLQNSWTPDDPGKIAGPGLPSAPPTSCCRNPAI